MAVSPSGAGPDGDTLPHLDRCAAAYREEYGGNEYGGLPVVSWLFACNANTSACDTASAWSDLRCLTG
jgi:hypothetical protein